MLVEANAFRARPTAAGRVRCLVLIDSSVTQACVPRLCAWYKRAVEHPSIPLLLGSITWTPSRAYWSFSTIHCASNL